MFKTFKEAEAANKIDDCKGITQTERGFSLRCTKDGKMHKAGKYQEKLLGSRFLIMIDPQPMMKLMDQDSSRNPCSRY